MSFRSNVYRTLRESVFNTGQKYDVSIIGLGFASSLLVWILASLSRRVTIVDAAKHPRFAIGKPSHSRMYIPAIIVAPEPQRGEPQRGRAGIGLQRGPKQS